MLKVEKIKKGNITVIRHKNQQFPSAPVHNENSVHYRDKLLGFMSDSKDTDSVEIQYLCNSKSIDKRQRHRLRKAKLQSHSLLSALFQKTDVEKLSLLYGQYKAVVAENAELLIRGGHCETFWPFAFYNNCDLTGGLYVYPWLCGDTPLENYLSANQIQNGMSILTGICPLGNSVYAVDNQGAKHPVTDPNYKIPKGVQIVSITVFDEQHSYIDLNYEVLAQLAPLIHGLAKQDKPTLYFHFPMYEYMLVAVQYFLAKNFNMVAFEQYIKLLFETYDLHLSKMEVISKAHGVKFECVSPLKELFKSYSNNKQFDLFSFLKFFGVTANEIEHSDDGKETKIVTEMAQRLLTHLAMSDQHGVWKTILEAANPVTLDLFEIARYCYPVQVVHTKTSTQKPLCLIDSQFEKSIALKYEKLFAVKFGTIMAMHWMPPCFVNLNEHNCFYYLEENHISHVNQLIKSGIVTESCIRIGEMVHHSK